jgi:hypothetical protein
MRGIYLISLSYVGVSDSTTVAEAVAEGVLSEMKRSVETTTPLEIRVGYFGYCVISNGVTTCAKTIESLIPSHPDWVVAKLMEISRAFHDDTMYSGLM